MLDLFRACLLSLMLWVQPASPETKAPEQSKSPAPNVTVAEPTKVEWTVAGVKRTAILFVPKTAKASPTPVIFAFHGHGGKAENVVKSFGYQRLWPEAICVYMQGLPAPGQTDPEGKLPGWQKSSGDLEDRDLKFFDAVLASLKKDYKVDESRIYATGHSNGGGFTYVLWAMRGDVFAAVAPAAGGLHELRSLKPKPAMHIAGELDQTVPFKNQQRTMEVVRTINGCESKGKEWAKDCLIYESKTGTPFVSLIYPGTHKFPTEAPPLIVKFFKQEVKPSAASTPTDADSKPVAPKQSK
jgi:polyhydroxybutyrate depolymerase